MTDWNFNIDEAPKTGVIIAASICEKVVLSKWLEKEQRWEMFTKEGGPVAWKKYPSHPFHEDPELKDKFVKKKDANLENMLD